ncbi:MAG: Eco57I restriction-modification methylase domain-containing protein [Myxococcales bacterium]|nr:Eco57I restriction-modification methylase domain-containing protein [Myxococcales bacterium]
MSGPDQGLAQIAALLKNTTPPDVLETIAHISSDEVLTPPKLANRVLDLLPAHIWHDPRIRILDPAVKSGVFLREAAKRLMAGLADVIPDVTERREHILRKMLYGVAITELTALMSRRSLYCASDATRRMNPAAPENCFSAVIMDTPEGNIAFPETEHDYDPKGKCRVCGANRGDLDGADREGRENHAYAFIHTDIRTIFGEDMKFDVIIGNPPYQLKDGGHGASASPIYQHFVDRAKALEPRYLSMIIPARWYAGGKGLDEFRAEMLKDEGMAVLVDIPDAAEAFPGVEIKGGVCYFLREPTRKNGCEVRTLKGGAVASSMTRALGGYDVLIRHNEAVSILEKVLARATEFVEEQVSRQKPFGFRTNFTDFSATPFPGAVQIYARDKVGWIDPGKIEVSRDWVEKYKVLLSMAYNGGDAVPHQISGTPIIAAPGSACTETYLVVGHFNDEDTAVRFERYARTRFFRFMLSMRKNTQHITRDRFRFVPKMDMSRTWTDADLYAHFGLTEDEIAFIEATIKEMP